MGFSYKFGVAILVSALAGALLFFLGYKYSTGAFEQWQPLAKPPEQVARIAGTTMGSVTIQTISGKLYTCETSALDTCWTKTKEIPADPHPEYFHCKPPKATSDLIEIRKSCYLDPGGEHAMLYALKTDGSLYFKNAGYVISGESTWAIFLLCPLGLVLGFLATWIFFFFKWLRTIS